MNTTVGQSDIGFDCWAIVFSPQTARKANECDGSEKLYSINSQVHAHTHLKTLLFFFLPNITLYTWLYLLCVYTIHKTWRVSGVIKRSTLFNLIYLLNLSTDKSKTKTKPKPTHRVFKMLKNIWNTCKLSQLLPNRSRNELFTIYYIF